MNVLPSKRWTVQHGDISIKRASMNSNSGESRHYEQAIIEGWGVLISPLLQGSPAIAQGMRARLAVGLRAIARHLYARPKAVTTSEWSDTINLSFERMR
jgi:hypothetical protein